MTIGRIVQFCIGRLGDETIWRPAVVVRVWGPTCVNLQVLLDGTNDTWCKYADKSNHGILWMTSVTEGVDVGEWRWPPRDGEK